MINIPKTFYLWDKPLSMMYHRESVIFVVLGVFLVALFSCQKKGQVSFQTNMNNGCGAIEVKLNGETIGDVTHVTGDPGCGSSDLLTVKREEGTYTYEASDPCDNQWSGKVKIEGNECKRVPFQRDTLYTRTALYVTDSIDCGPIGIYANSEYQGTITESVSADTIECGDKGTVTMKLDISESYYFRAEDSCTVWDADAPINKDSCEAHRVYI